MFRMNHKKTLAFVESCNTQQFQGKLSTTAKALFIMYKNDRKFFRLPLSIVECCIAKIYKNLNFSNKKLISYPG